MLYFATVRRTTPTHGFPQVLFFFSVRHLRRDLPGDASGVVGLGSDEDDARLLQLLEEEVDEQEVSQVVNAYSFLETVRRPSRLLVLNKNKQAFLPSLRKKKKNGT